MDADILPYSVKRFAESIDDFKRRMLWKYESRLLQNGLGKHIGTVEHIL